MECEDSPEVKIKVEQDLFQYIYQPSDDSQIVDQKPVEGLMPVALISTGVKQSESTDKTVGEIVQVKEYDKFSDNTGGGISMEDHVLSGKKFDSDLDSVGDTLDDSGLVDSPSMVLEVFENGSGVSTVGHDKLIHTTFSDMNDEQFSDTGDISALHRSQSGQNTKLASGAQKQRKFQGIKQHGNARKVKSVKKCHKRKVAKKQNVLLSRVVKGGINGESTEDIDTVKFYKHDNLESQTNDSEIDVENNTNNYPSRKQRNQGKQRSFSLKDKHEKDPQRAVYEVRGDDEGEVVEEVNAKIHGKSQKLEEWKSGSKNKAKKKGNMKKDNDVSEEKSRPKKVGSKCKAKKKGNMEKDNDVFDDEKSQLKKVIKCEYCSDSRIFPNKPSLRQHWTSCHRDRNLFKCCLCSEGFPSELELRRHKYHEYNKSPQKMAQFFSCQYCKKIFKKKSNLNAHQRIHTGEKPYVCEDCGKAFSLLNSLKRHSEVHVKKEQLGSYSCHVCGKTFDIEPRLKRHLDIHKEDRSQPCEICGKIFASKISLSWHLKIHLDIRKHVCEHCGAKFCKSNRLKCHLKNDKNRARLTCTFCEHVSPCSGTVKSHLFTHPEHSQKYKLSCSQCGLRFMKKRDLHSHTLTHLDKSQYPFCCDYCNKYYPRKDRLIEHLKSAHNQLEVSSVVPKWEVGSDRLEELLQSNQLQKDKDRTDLIGVVTQPLEEISALPVLKKEHDEEDPI